MTFRARRGAEVTAMQDRTRVLVGIFLGVGAVALALLVKGWRTGVPPGQRGLKGTGLERDPTLYRVQMSSLGLLLLACLAGAVWALTR